MAIDVGYRHFDINWRNEEAAGKAFKKWIDDGKDRKDLFVTVKVWAKKWQLDISKNKNSVFSYPFMPIEPLMLKNL